MEIEKKFQCQKMATDLLAMIRYAKKSILKTISAISHYQSEKSAALVRNLGGRLTNSTLPDLFFFFILIWFDLIFNENQDKSKSNL